MMLKIEKKETHNENVEGGVDRYLVVNSLEDVHSHYFKGFIGISTANFYDEDVIRELLKFSPKDVGFFFDSIGYQKQFDDSASYISVEIFCNTKDTTSFRLISSFQIDFVNWNKPYSIADFAEEMSSIIEADDNPLYKYFEVDDDEIITNGFGFTVSQIDDTSILSEVDEGLRNYAENLFERTQASLLSKLDANVLVTFFTFPEPIKTACKQYLIYFTQFLMDLGIDADTEIKEDAHNTLFKVIPKDTNESLAKIKDALSFYLNVSSISDLIVITTENSNDISIMQWQANVLHLKSQLMIANSIMQLKDATIEQLQLSNYQYKNSLQITPVKNEVDKEEAVIEGILSVKKYDGKGFTVNFAEILRRMKRTFGPS